MTWADFLVADFLESIRRLYPTVLSSYPILEKYHNFIHSLPQLQNYLSKRDPKF